MFPNGTPATSYKHVHTAGVYLYPNNIINTYDNGFLVVGWYIGPAPAGYPGTPGASISALFYAKFSNTLALLSFRVHYSNSWVTDVNNVVASDIDGNGVEEYIINYSSGSNTFTHLLRIDNNLNPVLEKQYPFFRASKISYLPTNNKYALTGGYNGKYTITLLNGSLSIISPVVSLSATQSSTFAYTTGVVEQKNNPNNIIWSFVSNPSGQIQSQCGNIPYIGGFTGTGFTPMNTYVVKMDVALNLIAEREFTMPCSYFLAPVVIHNNPTASGIVVGTNQMYNVVDGSGTNVTNTKGGLLALDYNLNYQSSYIYNPQDLTYDNPNGGYYDDLRYLYPITTAIGNSYILHLSYVGSQANFQTRIINAYPSGLANCSEVLNIASTNFVHQVQQ